MSLKNAGFTVYPVNPKYDEIDGDRCFNDLSALVAFLSGKPDFVITITPPKVTEKIVQQCITLDITRIWMQPGSESASALSLCKKNNIEVVHDVCIIVDALNKI